MPTLVLSSRGSAAAGIGLYDPETSGRIAAGSSGVEGGTQVAAASLHRSLPDPVLRLLPLGWTQGSAASYGKGFKRDPLSQDGPSSVEGGPVILDGSRKAGHRRVCEALARDPLLSSVSGSGSPSSQPVAATRCGDRIIPAEGSVFPVLLASLLL